MIILNGRSIIICFDVWFLVEFKKISLLSFWFKIMVMEGERFLFILGEFYLIVLVL